MTESSVEVLAALQKCMADLQAKPKRVYTDWGSEFEGAFSEFCSKNSIGMKKSCTYTAWQNGLVERVNRSIVNVAKTLMQQSNLPVEFWAHAVCTAAYIINRLSHKRLPGGITPYEAMHGKRPNISNLHPFGCHAEVLIQKRYRRKDLTDSNSESVIFIGYCRQSTGYIFYVPHKHLVVSRRDAAFNEAYFPARVGETMLIDRSTIKTELADGETNKIEDSSKLPPTVTMEWLTAPASPTVTDNDKNSDGHDKNTNDDENSTASKNIPKPHRLDAEPHDASPDAKQSPHGM